MERSQWRSPREASGEGFTEFRQASGDGENMIEDAREVIVLSEKEGVVEGPVV